MTAVWYQLYHPKKRISIVINAKLLIKTENNVTAINNFDQVTCYKDVSYSSEVC
jgi:hypothetical protein